MRKGALADRFSSSQIIPLGFLLMILAGTLLLMLPFATQDGEQTSFLTALFTATTSVCVTGLVVVNTAAHWTIFGKIVILLLIQLGGLGIIAVTSIVTLVLRRRFSLKGRILIMDAFNLNSLQGLVSFLIKVIKGTFAIELLGTAFYMFRFAQIYGIGKGLWISFFTSVSAFCNAGIDIIGDQSLIGFQNDPLVLTVTMMLIIMGGLGFVVWFNAVEVIGQVRARKVRPSRFFSRLGEHTKLVLFLTFFLIITGAVSVFLLEKDNAATIGGMSTGGKILNSFFQSVTFRTAGFASVPQEGLSEASALLGCVFMFIGGSPVGTAGGVKTVTIFALVFSSLSYIRNQHDTTVMGRRFGTELLRKAVAIIVVNMFFTLFFSILLIATNGVSGTDGIYEVTSAVATVGLSRDITSSLNGIGRIIIIAAMYLGRIGPISIALFFTGRKKGTADVVAAEGKFFVG